MGRPLAKDILGIDAIGDADGSTGIRVEFYDASLRTDGAIVKQRGAKTFICTRDANIGTPNIKDSTLTTTCVLKNGAPNAIGQMRLFGYVGSNSGTEVNIAKITKRVATDFSGNRYTWALENDSTNDYIVLTAV
tara:strand:- start:3725 stop:4126 length:402 start_codon:yes stop_codon:yes gene_type:complete